ncbi:MAG: chemotaxis protein CheW [Pseudomonadota bacterium]
MSDAHKLSIDSGALYSLLVPLEQMRLIVPRDCVAEVVGWDAARHARRDAHTPWLMGKLPWGDVEVPVISFEGLCGINVEPPAHRARVVLMRCLGDAFSPGYFGILTAGFPQLVRVSAEVLVADEQSNWPASAPVLCQLRMVGQSPVIPDLELLEHQLAETAA